MIDLTLNALLALIYCAGLVVFLDDEDAGDVSQTKRPYLSFVWPLLLLVAAGVVLVEKARGK